MAIKLVELQSMQRDRPSSSFLLHHSMAALPVDPESQIAPADAQAKLIEKALPVLWQLISPGAVKAFGPTAPKDGHERAFALYVSALLILYGLDVFLAACVIAIASDMKESAWARKAMRPALFAALATSFAVVMLGTVLSLLP